MQRATTHVWVSWRKIRQVWIETLDLFCSPPPPPVFLWPPVTNYMLLHSTLLCKKIARAPGGHKKFMLTKLGGGGGGENRSETLFSPLNLRHILTFCDTTFYHFIIFWHYILTLVGYTLSAPIPFFREDNQEKALVSLVVLPLHWPWIALWSNWSSRETALSPAEKINKENHRH